MIDDSACICEQLNSQIFARLRQSAGTLYAIGIDLEHEFPGGYPVLVIKM